MAFFDGMVITFLVLPVKLFIYAHFCDKAYEVRPSQAYCGIPSDRKMLNIMKKAWVALVQSKMAILDVGS